MLGIVFTTLVEMLEEKISPEFADEVLVDAQLENDGAFTAVGYYPFEDMQKLLGVLCEKTGKEANELLHMFGEYLFGVLAAAHSQVMDRKNSLFATLLSLDDDIHVQVLRLYPDSDLPSFQVVDHSENFLRIKYVSKRNLYALAEGLIDGAAAHFNEKIERETRECEQPNTYEFTIKLVK